MVGKEPVIEGVPPDPDVAGAESTPTGAQDVAAPVGAPVRKVHEVRCGRKERPRHTVTTVHVEHVTQVTRSEGEFAVCVNVTGHRDVVFNAVVIRTHTATEVADVEGVEAT
jgi:hypothetical protein